MGELEAVDWLDRLYGAVAIEESATASTWRLPDASGEISDVLRSALQRHLERARNLQDDRRAAGQRACLLASLLDALPHALILCDGCHQITWTSRLAHEALRIMGGIAIADGRLHLRGDSGGRRLSLAIDAALERHAVTAVEVTAPGTAATLSLVVSPFANVAGGGDRRWALLLVDPSGRVTLDKTLLRGLYGLTRAEADLAAHLAAGASLEEAADVLCVSINTVRTHLQRIFGKTGTARQPQLVRRLLTGPACLLAGRNAFSSAPGPTPGAFVDTGRSSSCDTRRAGARV